MTQPIEMLPISTEDRWTELFNQCPETDLQQTWAYGESVQDCIDWQPFRHVILIDHQPVAIAQTLLKTVPLLGRVARIQHGPLFLLPGKPAQMVVAIKKLRQHWVDDQQATLHLTPAILPGNLPPDWAADCGLSPTREVLWASVRVDLTQPSEKIRTQMHRKWRKPLEKAEKSGLEIQISNAPSEFDFFLENYAEATREKGISWPSVELTRQLWVHAQPQMQVFTALKNDVRIAAMVPLVYGTTSYALVAWNGPLSAEFHAHNFLIWQVILFYKKMGLRWFDLGGIDPVQLPGITQFKRNLGGAEYRFEGNFEARPAGVLEEMTRTESLRGLGHVLPGLEMPSNGDAAQNDVAGKVLQLLSDFIRQATGYDGEIGADISLINGGLIDSLSLVSVIQSLQDAFDIEIGVTEITIDNFDSVQAISQLIKSKLEY